MIKGWEYTQAVMVMIRGAQQHGPVDEVLMHPNDYRDLRDEFGDVWVLKTIMGIPIRLDASIPQGKVYALRKKREN